jgi:hypothetical protein
MFIRTANRYNIHALHPQVSGVNIGRYINPCKVTNMYWPVSIGKSRGDEISFKILHETDAE